MVSSAAFSLKPGGRLVGARERLDSASRGRAPTTADTSRGPLRFAFTLACGEGDAGTARDFCTCDFEFGDSGGSTFEFQSHPVSEATMIAVFAECGLWRSWTAARCCPSPRRARVCSTRSCAASLP